MAQKKSSPHSKKPSSKTPKSSSRGAPSRASSARTGSTKKRTQKNLGDNLLSYIRNLVNKKPAASQSPRPIRKGISPDRKLDILGVVLTLVGFLTLLGFLSPINSSLIGTWVDGLGKAFGWGKFLFSMSLIVSGLWLVLRNFERIPIFAVERIIGIILLFINLLAFMHLMSISDTEGTTLAIVQAGEGGGFLGGVVLGVLQSILGTGGAVIALIAWLLIALALTLDISVVDMVQWIPPLFNRLHDWTIELSESYRNHRAKGISPSTYLDDTFPPTPGKLAGSQTLPEASYIPIGNTAFGPNTGLKEVVREWALPKVDQILDKGQEISFSDDLDMQRARVIEETLSSFGAPARVIEINRGPTITQFGVEPDFLETRGGRMRVRVGKITSLADDLALALSARTIRIQAPVPGKGFVGIEVPNEEISLVALRDLIESEAFKRLKSPLRFALGLNVSGHAVAADMAVMPHLLIAGATG
jgi:S-DNA-T family DNA segregation ATPase FtsK/SpoIIIE